MWLVQAVGSINGQDSFQFVLEQKRSYLVGRDKAAEIRFTDRSVRPKEGVLEVGDWDPTDFKAPPKLIWRAEPKKNGIFPPLKALSQRKVTATYRRDDYDVEELDGGDGYEFATGNGITISSDVSVFAKWADLHIAYDGFKNEREEFKDGLRKHCVSYTLKTDPDTDVVIAEELSNAVNPSLAVCYGINIVTPAWLQALSIRLKVCWKKNADSEDSFVIPDVNNPDYQPKMKEGLPAHRADLGSWRIDKSNRTLFSKYAVVGLVGPKKPLKESPYLTAMGATFKELNIVSRPLVSDKDFLERLQPARDEAKADGREVIAVYYPSLKKELEAKSINFEQHVSKNCSTEGIYYAGLGPMVWGVVREGSVKGYFDTKVVDRRQQSAAPEMSTASRRIEEPTSAAEPEPTPAQTSGPKRLVRRGGTSSGAPSRAPSVQPDVVPSTYPEGVTISPPKAPPPPVEPPPVSPPKSAVRKPLRRRAGRAKLDLDDDLDMDEGTQVPEPQASFVPDTQFSSGSGTQLLQEPRSRVPDSMEYDTQVGGSMAPPASTRPGARLKLKRRAGATQSSVLNDFDTTVDYEEEVQKAKTAREIRDLYEQETRETASLRTQPNKRQRTVPPPESVQELMDLDDDEDFVTKNMRATRPKRSASPVKAAAPPAKKAPEPVREETPEEVEPVVQPPKKSKGKAATQAAAKSMAKCGYDVPQQADAPPPSQVDKDEAFLQAIAKSKKKGLDDMDREFNAMHIRKMPQQRVEIDYSILRDFPNLPCGNFIEIVREDLFRKDPPRVKVPVADDGRPNFKKFKKKSVVRREPMKLVLGASTNAAEMGEPYWDAEDMGTQRGTQKKSQSQTAKTQSQRVAMLEEEDEAPLLPRSKRRLLTQIQEEDDAEDFSPVPATRRCGITPMTQSQPDPPARRRNARSGSAASDWSTASSTPAPPPTRQPARARRGTQASRPVVIDDDSDDEPVFATARSSTRTRATRGSGAVSSTAVQATGLSTIDFDDEVPSSTRATAGSSRVSGRRKLLVEDDGDDKAFTGVTKKRRLG